MHHFKDILVAVDANGESFPAFERAARLAEQNQAKLKIVDGYRDFSWLAKLGIENPSHLRDLVVKEKEERLEQLAASLREKGLDVSTKVLQGRFSMALIQEVLSCGHDLVIRTPKGVRSHSTRNWGNTSIALLRRCPCAVWLVQPHHAGINEKVLVSVDATPHDEDHAAINRRILDMATVDCPKESGSLHIVSVWNIFGEELHRNHMRSGEFERLEQSARDAHEKHFNEVLAPYGYSTADPTVHHLHGDPTLLIPQLTIDQDIDLLMLGTVARTGIPGLVIGNTAELILSDVKCSVLALKPEGFVCPVKLQR